MSSVGTLQRLLQASAVVLTCAVFLPSASDPVNLVKLTLLMLAAWTSVIVGVVGAVRTGEARLPSRSALVVASGFALAIIACAAVADNGTSAVLGAYGRNAGLLAYGSGIVLFLFGRRLWSLENLALLLFGFVVAGTFTATYGAFQLAGIDAIHWKNDYNPVISSLGNPDFASGYLGLCVPAAAWCAFHPFPRAVRIAGAGLTGFLLAIAVASRAVQGPAAAAAGLAVLATAVALNRTARSRAVGLTAVGGTCLAALTGVLAGMAGVGPLAAIFSRSSFQARRWYWQAAWSMFRSRPWTGVGLEQFGVFWRIHQPPAAILRFAGADFTDSAHSVPMQMLAQGGLPLALGYGLLIVSTAAALARGLRRTSGTSRLALGGIGGVWTAYVVQSTVSIDHVALLTANFAAVGAIWGATRLAPDRVWTLPLNRMATQRPPRGSRQRRPERPMSRSRRGVLAGIVAVGCGGAWLSVIPLRANVDAHSGDIGIALGDGNRALNGYQRAVGLVPGESVYRERLAAVYQRIGMPDLATGMYLEGLRHDPENVVLLRDAAALVPWPKSSLLLHRAVALDPYNPDTLLQSASVDLGHGQAVAAEPYLERGVRALPYSAALWIALGKARRANGDAAGAITAFTKALALTPTDLNVQNLLRSEPHSRG